LDRHLNKEKIMGWSGYGLYDGDCTQSCHFNFIEWAEISDDYDEIFEWVSNKTVLPEDKKKILEKNAAKIWAKMPKVDKYFCTKRDSAPEIDALQYQMLLSLFVDNNIKPPKYIYDKGIEATEFLSGEHASEFDYPGRRRSVLKRFAAKATKLYKGTKTCQKKK
jgi:hypothetical protein